MTISGPKTDWIDALPPLRGRLTHRQSMAGVTWFGVGGAADVAFRPADLEDLAIFMAALPVWVTVTVVGVGSNLLVRDGGIEGVVIRLGRSFAGITVAGVEVTAGAAVLDGSLAYAAAEAGVAGFSFLCGIPGTIGGAVRMNAGAYGGEMAIITQAIDVLDRSGKLHHILKDSLDFSYRCCALPEDWVITTVYLKGEKGDRVRLAKDIAVIRSQREETQPVRAKTGGSTFKNPPGEKAWKLIDCSGCRGLTRGGAMVSDKHCNFLINTGAATASELEDLGEEVRRRVFDNTGIMLEWEIRLIGSHTNGHGRT